MLTWWHIMQSTIILSFRRSLNSIVLNCVKPAMASGYSLYHNLAVQSEIYRFQIKRAYILVGNNPFLMPFSVIINEVAIDLRWAIDLYL